ncbi:MAG: FkbM family methyltransferase [Acidobacteria bacterium]|nr:FkbM family methyltransferase [Acidobacteriota bacterium]
MILQRAARRAVQVVGQDSRLARTARPIYARALSWLAQGHGIPWTINGTAFRINPDQRHRMGEHYDADVAAYLRTHIRPGSTCFDVGANVGVYALQFARWTGPGGRVVAFEPNPVAAATLRDHIRMNELAASVEVVQAALAERSGLRTLHMADADGMSRLGTPNPEIAARTSPVDVAVTTLDDYCGATCSTPDWLLIDVEGFELAVLSGARRTIARHRARLHVIVEMHPDAWNVAGWTRQAAEALLEELELSAAPLSGQTDPLGTYGHVLLRPRSEIGRIAAAVTSCG